MSNNLNKAYLVLEESTGNAKGNNSAAIQCHSAQYCNKREQFSLCLYPSHLLCFSIDSGQIFLNKSFRKSLSLAKSRSRTGRCLASHTCEFADHVSTP